MCDASTLSMAKLVTSCSVDKFSPFANISPCFMMALLGEGNAATISGLRA